MLLFQKLQEAAPFSGKEAMVKRSVFKLASVVQLQRCMESEGWMATEKFHGGIEKYSECQS